MTKSHFDHKAVFISGSRKLPKLNSAICTKLRNIIEKKYRVLVGDASGADKAVQTFLAKEGYKNVVVYCMDGECRNNIDNWEKHSVDSVGKKKDFEYFAMKDVEMSRDADYGLMLWDGKSKGTLKNALNMLEQGKNSWIYFSPERSFVRIKSATDIKALVDKCDLESKSYFDKKIKFSERIQLQQMSLEF